MILKILHSEREICSSLRTTNFPTLYSKTQTVCLKTLPSPQGKEQDKFYISRSWQFQLIIHEQMPSIQSIWYAVEAQYIFAYLINTEYMEGFLGSSAGKEFACTAGDLGSIPGFRSPGERKGYPLQYSGL